MLINKRLIAKGLLPRSLQEVAMSPTLTLTSLLTLTDPKPYPNPKNPASGEKSLIDVDVLCSPSDT